MSLINCSPEIEELTEEKPDLDQDGFKDLIVHNDDFNTFEHVIETLMEVCKHGARQAEQCTHIIHHKGKCAVKKGPAKDLRPMKEAINDAGISATIE